MSEVESSFERIHFTLYILFIRALLKYKLNSSFWSSFSSSFNFELLPLARCLASALTLIEQPAESAHSSKLSLRYSPIPVLSLLLAKFLFATSSYIQATRPLTNCFSLYLISSCFSFSLISSIWIRVQLEKLSLSLSLSPLSCAS